MKNKDKRLIEEIVNEYDCDRAFSLSPFAQHTITLQMAKEIYSRMHPLGAEPRIEFLHFFVTMDHGFMGDEKNIKWIKRQTEQVRSAYQPMPLASTLMMMKIQRSLS